MLPEEFLKAFVETEDKILKETVLLKREQGFDFAVAQNYMEKHFQEFDHVVRPIYRPWVTDTPNHITELHIHSKGEQVFSDDANLCLMRMGYFFGCCLLKESDRLCWAIGNSETALANQLVIAGFPNEIECPTVEVCKNIIRKISDDRAAYGSFSTIYNVWRKSI